MWVEAIVAKDDLAKVVGELCPLRISIGADGNLLLSDPREVALIPGEGLRMTVTSEIHWPVLGIQIPVSIRSATLLVKPEIVEAPQGPNLTFRLQLDDVDIAILPALVDRGIVELVNKELAAKHVELAWGFTSTLSHVFELPQALASVRALDLRATSGRVKVTHEALALAVLFQARVEPRSLGPRPTPTPSPTAEPSGGPPPAPPISVRSLLRRSPAGLAAVCGMALLAGMGVVTLVTRNRRPRALLARLRRLGP
jgi:hypothetical protein